MRSTVVTEARRAGWRERWARQENERRQRAHAAALAAWRQQDAEHRRLLELGRSARPAADDGSYAWLGLKRGETIYWAGGARMVETPYAVALRPPDHAELPPVQPLAAVPALDTGRAAVTSQRVIFVGRSRREWSYPKLAGLAHSAAGQTLMLVSNRKKVSGIVPPQPADFRLRLALAMADAAGDRRQLVAQLERQVEQHRRAMPPAPAPATADQAPLSAWFSRGSGLAAAIALPVLFLLLCTAGAALAGNDEPAESSLPSAEPATAPSREAAARSPSPSPTPSGSPVASSASPEPARAAATERPEPEGDCAAYHDSDDWCVNGAGDYDCEGGTGNGPNYAPRGVEVAVPGVDPFGLDRNDDGEGCEGRAAPERPEPPPPDAGTDPQFGTCAEANAAGYGPYHRGEPEYDWYRDADGDGVVCER